MIVLLNNCYRQLQDDLISHGVETFNKYGEIVGIPPFANANPSEPAYLGYTGFFDGVQVWSTWTLPTDCIKPLELWERQNGNNSWVRMSQAADSLSSRPIMTRFGEWDFETDLLYLPPSSGVNDLKMKYLCYAPDISNTTSPILIVRCQHALAYRLLTEVAKSRGGLEMASVWAKDAQAEMQKIVNRTARKESYGAYFRRPFRHRRSNRGRHGN